ncbi:multiple inositol polyphosphate histidine phosphatase [Capsaspora owczarzaki ATCC 30864]|uniref:Multiple inositol polyphosphate phosphatase 1 n=1 Tax=Capsaspora owczarzaki (strain ATCC 30864) TaxID=595528 RepID=A0A0D2UFR5_CAPO3|nr:multiple inositol polyphosphate histidine phosphatase [Capsaspora owczarzaki ATCC 30864]KJE93976.1 multiple inositol polyphosphate histidine phosphatase [Capsaspora owczarzaki ATCC 30864]|eukprot:XP_004347432.1 multiple inositol polyphosphate histidine phosphatase [Capsaspora owczarzaki ATCC 30864]
MHCHRRLVAAAIVACILVCSLATDASAKKPPNASNKHTHDKADSKSHSKSSHSKSSHSKSSHSKSNHHGKANANQGTPDVHPDAPAHSSSSLWNQPDSAFLRELFVNFAPGMPTAVTEDQTSDSTRKQHDSQQQGESHHRAGSSSEDAFGGSTINDKQRNARRAYVRAQAGGIDPARCQPGLPRLFGTKTVYWDQVGDDHNRHIGCGDAASPYLLDGEQPAKQPRTLVEPQHEPEFCKPVHLSMTFRHGTRYPSTGDIRKLDKLLVELQTIGPLITNPKHQWIRGWQNPFLASDDKTLAPRGEAELFTLARRLVRKYSNVFIEPYHPNKYEFTSTRTTRCAQSAASFAQGVFEGNGRLGTTSHQPIAILSESVLRDNLLRFFDSCQLYVSGVIENKTAMAEQKKFLNGPVLQEIATSVAQRLHPLPQQLPNEEVTDTKYRDKPWKQFKKKGKGAAAPTAEPAAPTVADSPIEIGTANDTIQLAPRTVVAMYLACAFEIAFNNTARWCSLFSRDDLEAIEYMGDLKHYWGRAYGYDINLQSSCLLFKDMYTSVVQSARGENLLRRATFRFAHAETLIPLFAYMGLFKDEEEIRADNFAPESRNRKFRASTMMPFSGNAGFVLYECDEAARQTAARQERDVLVHEIANTVKLQQRLLGRPLPSAREKLGQLQLALAGLQAQLQEVEQRLQNGSTSPVSHLVKFTVNERAMPLERCGGKELCPFDEFVAGYQPLVDACDFDGLCMPGGDKFAHPSAEQLLAEESEQTEGQPFHGSSP